MPAGKIKWFHNARGCGFNDTGASNLFARFSAVQQDGRKSLRESREVEYEVAERL